MSGRKTTKSEGPSIPSPDDTMAVALSLAKAGWYVFPVRLVPVTKVDEDGAETHATDKRPLIAWREGATTDLEQIATWWGTGVTLPSGRTVPASDLWIGVHAGRSGLVVVDLDQDKGHGSGKANLKAARLKLAPTLRYTTRSGGTHHVYAAPKDRALTLGQGGVTPGLPYGVDIRAGTGLMVYYGPIIKGAPDLAPAPDWALIDRDPTKGARGADGDVGEWLERAQGGKPSKELRKLAKKTPWSELKHDPMLEAVSTLIRSGTAPGAATVYAEARAAYVAGRPDRERDWDNAAAGSIGKHGLPPVTLELTKAERAEVKRRASPEVVEEKKRTRTAERVRQRIEDNDGQLTDAALAEVFAEELDGQWANTPGRGIIRYDGIVWRAADEALLVEVIRRRMRVARAEATRLAILRQDKQGEAEAKILEARSKIVAVTRLAAGIMLERTPELDRDPDVLNVLNGVVDLRTGKMRERRADDFFTKVTAVEYHPGARSRDWRSAVKALPKPTRAWVKVRLGQACTGRISRDKAVPFFVGGGDNGKSVVIGAVRAVLADYAVTVPERLLLGSDSDHPTDIMTLQGARAAFFEELPRGGRLNAQRLKLLSGTNRLSGRRMRMDFEEFPATHTLIGATNHLPLISDVDDAVWARVAPVPFPFKFVAGTPKKGTNQRAGDEHLRDRLAETPDPAVLTWLIEGAVESYRDVPEKPAAVLDAFDEWRGEADPVLSFTRERLILDEDYAIPATDLYAEFGRFLESRSQQRWGDPLIASSFKGHSALPGVEKRQVVFGKKLHPSRPTFSIGPVPPRPMSWVGIRFREEEGAMPVSPEVAEFEKRMRQ